MKKRERGGRGWGRKEDVKKIIGKLDYFVPEWTDNFF